ncbi:MAG: hypothetical protein DBP02_13395 [gamma proteobacterium symbiont of Ctena orbiculata]|nr:MAG: hypothetical protein DBP02_13395 [gamma proteobacterium symbiont of Ctena orbiculata]PUB89886.1 MAG: hypothetical protein DBP01_09130 [gamma proteobacterium symbiont of Ctena orbiculata]
MEDNECKNAGAARKLEIHSIAVASDLWQTENLYVWITVSCQLATRLAYQPLTLLSFVQSRILFFWTSEHIVK